MKGDGDIILGIDPGTRVMGYGLLRVEGAVATAVLAGAVTMPHGDEPYERLLRVAEKMRWLLTEYHPAELAIEAPFLGLNAQTLLALARAQGVCISAAREAGLNVAEYAPAAVKLAVTGHGNASKQQVAEMLHKLLRIERNPKYLDATDALAVAYTHHRKRANSELRAKAALQTGGVPIPTASGKKTSWADFAAHNPDRVSK